MTVLNRTITKRSNPTIHHARQVRDGLIGSHIFCEGYKLVEELVKANLTIHEVFCIPKLEGSVRQLFDCYKKSLRNLTFLSSSVMEFVSDLTTPPGLIALAEKPQESSAKALKNRSIPLVLILHQIQLPQNVGAMIRTAEAAGVTDVWTTPKTVDPFGPKALRGSSGSVFRVPIRTATPLHDAIKDMNINKTDVYGASQDGKIAYDQVPWEHPSALILGSEGSGFTIEEMKYLHETVRIPMMGQVESLNVGIAAAVCLFEAQKKRLASNPKKPHSTSGVN